MRAQQNIEALKIPLFVELANDYIHNGYSVVIFVNFTKTLEKICEMLHTDNKIYGEQTIEDRTKIIENFQENRSKIIVCNIKAGGIGISLHDIHGGHPRVSLISPTWSSIDLIQALGRIHRAGGKSKSLQRIIYAAETVEDKIADKIKSKLSNINSINNGDLDLTNINFQTERIK
jgi:SNF2 family DNA or RNA helicase